MAMADDVRRLADAAEKLLSETLRLRRDVAVIHGRIEPFDDEKEITLPAVPVRVRWRVVDALDVIEAARESIRNCEIDLSVCRAKLDEILDNEARRDEIRPHIKK
jgi:hypothetical protein